MRGKQYRYLSLGWDTQCCSAKIFVIGMPEEKARNRGGGGANRKFSGSGGEESSNFQAVGGKFAGSGGEESSNFQAVGGKFAGSGGEVWHPRLGCLFSDQWGGKPGPLTR